MVAKLILDTNIVSYLMKRHSFGQKYLPHLLGKLLAISFITVGELYVGAEKDKWGERKRLHLQPCSKTMW
ncbi:MAG: PIN domain-containing protein [bacterium]